jgi:hypothetical protein
LSSLSLMRAMTSLHPICRTDKAPVPNTFRDNCEVPSRKFLRNYFEMPTAQSERVDAGLFSFDRHRLWSTPFSGSRA